MVTTPAILAAGPTVSCSHWGMYAEIPTTDWTRAFHEWWFEGKEEALTKWYATRYKPGWATKVSLIAEVLSDWRDDFPHMSDLALAEKIVEALNKKPS